MLLVQMWKQVGGREVAFRVVLFTRHGVLTNCARNLCGKRPEGHLIVRVIAQRRETRNQFSDGRFQGDVAIFNHLHQ